jgi:hypothetical protein
MRVSMSFDKAIEHGKEHRKPYKGLLDGDRSPIYWHGVKYRTHFDRKNRSRVADAMREYGGP